MSFAPKFVDLVRNTTTTVGTADFVLGAAVTGFTSFAAALQPGDSFYYSAIGVDKPAEREVGRGTLQTNGTISRSSIGGQLTNFSNGTKTVALIAAAEWYGTAQQLVAGASHLPAVMNDRASLAGHSATTTAYLREAGREGMFVWDGSDCSANVAADPRQGLTIAAATDPTGRSGAWVRNFNGSVSVKWFGAAGDGTANDGPAFTAALARLRTFADNPTSFYIASPRLFIPAGHYYLGTTTLDITHTLIIEGEGGMGFGSGGGCPTKLRWAANTTGIRVQAHNTAGASTVDGSPHSSGAFTTLRNLYLLGPLGSGGTLTAAGLSEAECHGLHIKATVFLDNLLVESFQGDGLYAHTTSGAGDATEGFSNCSRAYNCSFHCNRNGISIAGGDANIWTFIGCQAISNRACGVDDQSFLGNTHIGWHANGNGLYLDNTGATGFPAYVVSNGGNRYCPVQGQEANASTTAPTGNADTSTWIYLGAGGAATGVPAWNNGMSLRCAAPYRTNNVNAQNVFINPYTEGGQGAEQYVAPTFVIGGDHGAGRPRGSAVYQRNYAGVLVCESFAVAADSNFYGPGLWSDHFGYNHPTGGSQSLEWFGSDLCWTILRSSNPVVQSFQLLGEATANPVGRRRLNFPNGFGNGSLKELVGTAAPTSGTYVQGDRVRNSAPAVGQPKAWVCTVGGTPGTWVSEGNL